MLCPDLPINASGIITGNILPVLPELDGIAEVPGLVHTAQKTVHDVLCPEIKPGNPLERLWMKIMGIHKVQHIADKPQRASFYTAPRHQLDFLWSTKTAVPSPPLGERGQKMEVYAVAGYISIATVNALPGYEAGWRHPLQHRCR